MAVLVQFTFPSSREEPSRSQPSPSTTTDKRQQPQLHVDTDSTSRKEYNLSVPEKQIIPAAVRTLSTPPTSPTRRRSSTMGAQDVRMLQDSGALTPPGTPNRASHSKSNSTSSDFLSSLSNLRRGSSVSSISRPRLASLDSTPQPGSTELITFPHHLTDYQILVDDQGRNRAIGEGAWSNVYLASPCPPTSITSRSPPQTACGPEMTPPLTPVRTLDAGLIKLPVTPNLYAVKAPAMTSAKKVLNAEARILSYLSRFHSAETHIVSFYGLDTRTDSLLLRAMDSTLEGWMEKHLNALSEASRAEKLVAIFPGLALSLIDSLMWMQEKSCTHADIKPSNILVSTLSEAGEDDVPVPVYSDFSSSLLTLPSTTIESSASPLGAGTWDYLDPTLLSSSNTAPPSAASDLWSLAITLLGLVLGASPYDAFRHNKFQQREMIKSGCPLQCMAYGDQGIRNMQRVKALERGLGFDIMGWFGKVLIKGQGGRVGVEVWKGELERAVGRV
ncbi:serine threonine protein kinase [Stemphylium lycopersici]|nr:serine threonine protein kinase [Stemphylium lycopersici]